MYWSRRSRRIRIFYRRQPFFLLDSHRPGSLTLRDYSKVVRRHKQSFRTKKYSPKMSGGPMSVRARWFVVCLLTLVCLSIPVLVAAQGTTGRILGRVTDPTGALLAGVKVTLVNEATNVSRDATTSDSGDYDFVQVPVGTYRVEFDLQGFKKN